MMVKEKLCVKQTESLRNITHSSFRTLYAFVLSSFPVRTTQLAIANAGNVEEDRGEQGIYIHRGRMISVVGWFLIR